MYNLRATRMFLHQTAQLLSSQTKSKLHEAIIMQLIPHHEIRPKVDKKKRFDMHKEFSTKCIELKVILYGLKIEIRNHIEQCLSKWSEWMQEFSLTLMKDVV